MRVFIARRAAPELLPLLLLAAGLAAPPCAGRSSANNQPLTNRELSVHVDAQQGAWSLSAANGPPILRAHSGVLVDGHWLRSGDYPQHATAKSSFTDELGSGTELLLTCSGLREEPDLIFSLRVYEQPGYATVQVSLRNTTARELHVEALRAVEADGEDILELRGPARADRVLSDSFSEDWPPLRIYDLGAAPAGLHRAVGSQLIYNRESGQSFFLGALTSGRFLTVIHLRADTGGAATRVAAFSADSTGTTEIQRDFGLRAAPATDQLALSLRVPPGQDLAGERLLLEAGADYHQQLLNYGAAIRTLHKARVSAATPIGWWSWTAFYAAITEGETLANADWLSQHLKPLGYRYFHVDEGYQYARGEYTTTNTAQFPAGMRALGHHVTGAGLIFGVWTAPFEVTSRAWVYEHHKDWLVRNSAGTPIASGKVFGELGQNTDTIYTLDTTHPGAQEYLRQTYRTIVREWGARFIKLDFMDTTAIEGYRYRPDTTALEAQRIGLKIIREAVGEQVILDKDGSPMLNAVGLVDAGRISQDTAHDFQATREAAPGIAARFYMHRNFFVNDPDAFNTCPQQWPDDKTLAADLPLAAAEASIALSAVSGGMYEIGDDLPTLGSQKERLALVQNEDLLNMAKLGRASTPVDLLSYRPEDEQPSVFFLRESGRQSILTVFNWTKAARSRAVTLAELGLPHGHAIKALNVLRAGEYAPVAGGSIALANQPPESVIVLKLIDGDVPGSAPGASAQVPESAVTGESFQVSAESAGEDGAAIVDYHWDFGDGTSAEGTHSTHAYTRPADYLVRLKVTGVDGLSTELEFPVRVSGVLHAFPNLGTNRREADVPQ